MKGTQLTSRSIRELHAVIELAISVRPKGVSGGRIYDNSAIDFERLRLEFAKSKRKRTDVAGLKDAIEKRLSAMLAAEPAAYQLPADV